MTSEIYELIFRGLQAKYPGQAIGPRFRAVCAALDGGEGSGNFGHEGRPGKVGGSGEGGAEKRVSKPAEYRQKVSEMFKEITSGPVQDLKVYSFRKMDKKESEKLLEETGLDLTNYSHSITNTGIKHAWKQHGNEQKEQLRGQEAITEKDLELIPEITLNFDSVHVSSEQSEGRPVLVYKKKIGPEYVYLEMVLGKNKKELRFKDLWKMKGNKKEGENAL